MRRIIPAPTDILAPNVTNVKSKEFDVELITPMYGGGATTGCNDSDFPIRPTSIRGQLRFWWRATRGARFTTSKELFEEEEKIWGSTDVPSSTIVRVESPSWTKRRNYVGPRDDNYGFKRIDPEAYVLFSAAAADTNRRDLVKEDLQFSVSISYVDVCEQDVLCAVWAWVNFGGIGARTRRGCGALYCKDLAPNETKSKESIGAWFKEKMWEYEITLSTTIRDWPTLSNCIFIENTRKYSPLEAWKESIRPMKNFRQGEDVGRDKRTDPRKPAGRSRWPEPDTLRASFPSRRGYAHSPREFIPYGFPRAVFGLPIGFKFIDGDGPNGADRKGLKIKPEKRERMASPVILRPLKTGDNALPMIALFNSNLPPTFEISGTDHTFSREDVINAKLPQYQDSPMENRTNSGDAITALLKFAGENYSFEKVPI